MTSAKDRRETRKMRQDTARAHTVTRRVVTKPESSQAMTREECIETMARAMHDGPLCADVPFGEISPATAGTDSSNWCREMATAAYEAMQPHIQAREEAVREACEGAVGRISAAHAQEAKAAGQAHILERRTYAVSVLLEAKNAIRSLQIGGNDG